MSVLSSKKRTVSVCLGWNAFVVDLLKEEEEEEK
jgi:hypothetical protein